MSELNIIECSQGSSEWFKARLGFLGASRVADALRQPKRKGVEELASRRNMRLELAIERITGKPTEHFVSIWMESGIETEPLARAAYELRNSIETEQVGFVLHPSIQWAGCSPDGLVGADGLVEFKCPKLTTHGQYLLDDCVPEEYIPQMMWQMACCPGRQWNDFVSYCPEFPEPLNLFEFRLMRDDQLIAEMEAEAVKFLSEVETTEKKLRRFHENKPELQRREL